MPELEHVPISELGYDLLKPGVRTWIEQDLGWKREDIMSIGIENEILDDGYTIGEDGQKWAQKKLGKHHIVTL